MSHEAFLKHITEIGHSLSHQTILSFCEHLERLPVQASPEERVAIAKKITQPAAADAIGRLIEVWNRQTPQVNPNTFAWALRSASTMDEYHREAQSIEIVWTGPAFQGCELRRTDQVMLDLIHRAARSLFIVTFAAYDIPHIARALEQAAGRGVDIILIVESTEASAGKLKFDALHALGASAAKNARVYTWPLEKRAKDDAGNFGCLHVKCAVADENAALISSANLTGHALNLNMELGLLVRGGDIPRDLARHLCSMIKDGLLAAVSLNECAAS